MTLEDVFIGLTTGELAQLDIGGREHDGILPDDYKKVIPHVQLGLRDLHTRLPLREREVTIQQYDNMSFYKLDNEYAITNTRQATDGTPKYIMDTPTSRFTNDIIRIEQVFDELGREIPLNKSEVENGAFTPAYNVIQFPQAVGTNAVYITYRADHPPIFLGTTDPSTVEIMIPDYLLQALLFFVASRMFHTVTGQDTLGIAEMYRAKYLEEIALVEKHNTLRDNNPNYNYNIRNRGWA